MFNADEKEAIIEKLTDAIVSVEGEAMRPVTWVTIEELASGEWGIGGKALHTGDIVGCAPAGSNRSSPMARGRACARRPSRPEGRSLTLERRPRLAGGRGAVGPQGGANALQGPITSVAANAQLGPRHLVGALVVDAGGPFSHVAIVAREFALRHSSASPAPRPMSPMGQSSRSTRPSGRSHHRLIRSTNHKERDQ